METIIFTLLVIASILLLWHFLWKDYALDKLRDSLFSIRNDLFDIASENNDLNFENDLYISFENLINNTIRFGYRLSFVGAALFNLFVRIKYKKNVVKSKIEIEYNYMTKSITDKDLRDKLEQLKFRYEVAILKYFLKTSIVFIMLTCGLFIVLIFKAICSRAYDSIITTAKRETRENFQRKFISEVEYQAEAFA